MSTDQRLTGDTITVRGAIIRKADVVSIEPCGQYPDEVMLALRDGRRYSVDAGYGKTTEQVMAHWQAAIFGTALAQHPAEPATIKASAAVGGAPTFEIAQPDEETLRLYVNGSQVSVVTHDSAGWDGMDAVRSIFERIAAEFLAQVTHRENDE